MEAIDNGSQAKSMWNPKKGGFRAAMFVFIMSSFENVGFVANAISLVLYFMGVMHFDLSGSANTLTNFMGTTFLLTILGGFISDTYMNRLNTLLAFAFFEIVGYILFIMQAHYKNLHPDATCIECHLKGRNANLFYLSLCFMALGGGGIRGCLASLGADQFDKNHPVEKKQLASFFNWLLLSVTLGATFGVTIIAWISTQKNEWGKAFFISALLALVGFVFVALGQPFYRVRIAGDSPLLSFVQVIVVAIKNRKSSLPGSTDDLYEINEKDILEEKIPHTNELRFLDKAAVLPEGTTTPLPWKVCPVTKVEETKILIRMLPILASTVLMNTCLAQLQTFSVQQGYIMDRKLGSFPVPPASIPVIPLVFMSLLVPIYEFAFIPLARKITKNPLGITHLQRVGVGLVLSVLSMAIAAVIEVKRRNAFNLHLRSISLFWLSFQYGIFGVADLFTFVGLMEFFYREAPKGMRSLSTSFTFLSLSIGYYLSSVLVRVVEEVTARMARNGEGWLYGKNLNANRLDLFYWFLAVMSTLNFGVYLMCARWYRYRDSIIGNELVTEEVDGELDGEKKLVGEDESNYQVDGGKDDHKSDQTLNASENGQTNEVGGENVGSDQNLDVSEYDESFQVDGGNDHNLKIGDPSV